MPLRIDEMYAFVAVDADGNEGLAAFMSDHGWIPMVAADAKRLDSLKLVAKKLAQASRCSIRLLQFSTRKEIEVIS